MCILWPKNNASKALAYKNNHKSGVRMCSKMFAAHFFNKLKETTQSPLVEKLFK